MPSLEYFLVCRSVQKDIRTDDLSFINVLEDVSPETFPHTIPRAMAVSLWNFEPGDEDLDYQASLTIKVPNMPDANFPLNLARDRYRCRTIQGILGIPVETAGEVVFEVSLNGVHSASHTIRIHPPGSRAAGVGAEEFTEENRTSQ